MGRLRIDRLAGPPRPLLADDGRVVAARCYSATTVLTRLIGLLGTPDLADDEALWLSPCSSVHAVGLRARVGCAFVDGEGVVLRVLDPLPTLARVRGAAAAVECAAGTLDGLVPGRRLLLGSLSP